MSAVFATKEAILAVLTARNITGVNLNWAVPTKDEDYTEQMVYLGSTEESSGWGQLGGGRRVEDFTVEIVVFVEMWGDDPKSTEQRAREIWTEIEDALRDDLISQPSTLRTAGVTQFNRIERSAETGPATAEKWGALVTARVEFSALNT